MITSINDFWVSVKEKLPETPNPEKDTYSDEVLAYDKERGQVIAYYVHPSTWGEGGWETVDEFIPLRNVTHWMPLPDDPIDGESNEND